MKKIPKLQPRARLTLLIVLLVGAACSLLVWNPERLLSQGFTSMVPGIWAGPAFAVVFALGTLAFFPKPVLNAAAGAIFGIPEGLALAVIGTTLGAVLAFGLGRSLGREALQPLLKRKLLAALDRRLTDQGFVSVLLLRIVPGVPFQGVNFAAAFSGVRPWSFTAATALGVLPGTAAYVTAGATASSPTSPAFLVSIAAIVTMMVLTLAIARRGRRKRTPPKAVEPV
ncbi:TVP38/TMEM64 family protein [Streptomyces sporangiiformans]|uniref:TVP38/TMEM64 family membrane protein n=1 Tax=Streptomyces sporangiiformans TaxID=2315329 RepID=A0A505DBY2_9ACTN|nr:TVP38/TMEM64 family protein [Streptomyces sporangiiformans]TPQ19942.1 TVP38/TMEM64 family protein [Streptomyces sporangiiformans]